MSAIDNAMWAFVKERHNAGEPLSLHDLRVALSAAAYSKQDIDVALTELVYGRDVRADSNREMFALTLAGLTTVQR